jgi:hypothetical protein
LLGSTRYEVLDDPGMLIEIADWGACSCSPSRARRGAPVGRGSRRQAGRLGDQALGVSGR